MQLRKEIIKQFGDCDIDIAIQALFKLYAIHKGWVSKNDVLNKSVIPSRDPIASFFYKYFSCNESSKSASLVKRINSLVDFADDDYYSMVLEAFQIYFWPDSFWPKEICQVIQDFIPIQQSHNILINNAGNGNLSITFEKANIKTKSQVCDEAQGFLFLLTQESQNMLYKEPELPLKEKRPKNNFLNRFLSSQASPNTSVGNISSIISRMQDELDENNAEHYFRVIRQHGNIWVYAIVPTVFCSGSEYTNVRRGLLTHWNVKTIIHFPENIFSGKDNGHTLLIIRPKEMYDPYLYPTINILNLKNCAPLPIYKNELVQSNYTEMNRILRQNDPNYNTTIALMELGKFNYEFGADLFYLPTKDEDKYSLGQLLSCKFPRIETPNEELGFLLCDDDFTIDGIKKSIPKKERKIPEGTAYVSDPCLIITNNCLFYIHNGPEKLFYKLDYKYLVLHINTQLTNPEYLAYVLANHKVFRNKIAQIFRTFENMTIEKADYDLVEVVNHAFSEIHIYILRELSNQQQKMDNLNEQIKQEEKQRQSINIAVQDLIHMMGAPAQKIRSLLYQLRKQEVALQTVKSLLDNFDYMTRIMSYANSRLEDFKGSGDDLPILQNIKEYVAAWENYGGPYFSLSFTPGTTIAQEATIHIKQDMLALILDAILNNAVRHGFHKRANPGNMVDISVEAVQYMDTPYLLMSVKNNGESMPAEITPVQYASRGIIAGKTGHSGLGGYHVYTIVKNSNGFLALRKEEKWNVIIDILIPISNNPNNNLNKYNYECI